MFAIKFQKVFIIGICACIGVFSACKDSGKTLEKDPEGSDLAIRLSSNLEADLEAEGVSKEKAEIISSSGQQEANDVYLPSVLSKSGENVTEATIVPQHYTKGAIQAIDDAGIADGMKTTVAGIIMKSLVKSLNGELDSLSDSEKSALPGGMVEKAIAGLEDGGLGDMINLAIKLVMSEAVGTLDEAGFTEDLMNDTLKSMTKGAVGAIDETGLKGDQLNIGIGNVTAGATEGLGDIAISGYLTTDRETTVEAIVEGATSSLYDAGIDADGMKDSIKSLTTGAAGAVDDAGIDEDSIDETYGKIFATVVKNLNDNDKNKDNIASISSGMISAIGKIDIPVTKIPELLTEFTSKSIIALEDNKNDGWSGEDKASVVSSMAKDSIESLNDIRGLQDDQVIACVGFVVKGVVNELGKDGEDTDPVERKKEIIEFSKEIVGKLDDAGIPPGRIKDAAVQVIKKIHNSEVEIPLLEIQDSAKKGLEGIDSELEDWDIEAANQEIDDYDIFDDDPYKDEFKCDEENKNGCELLQCADVTEDVMCKRITGCYWETEGKNAPYCIDDYKNDTGELCYSIESPAKCKEIEICEFDASGYCSETYCSKFVDEKECVDDPECDWNGKKSICVEKESSEKEDCSDYDTEKLCKKASKYYDCTWDQETSSCSGAGTMAVCEDFTTEETCSSKDAIRLGCTWNKEKICVTASGKKECSSFENESFCKEAEEIGCIWDTEVNKCIEDKGESPEEPKACSDLTNETCERDYQYGLNCILKESFCVDNPVSESPGSCKDITDNKECATTELGCVWEKTDKGEFCVTPSPGTCKEIKDETDCKEAQKLGCFWDEGGCFFKIPESCEDITNPEICEKAEEYGCALDNERKCITETPKSCKDIKDQDKCKEVEKLGCIWDEEKGCISNSQKACMDFKKQEECDKAQELECTWVEGEGCVVKTPQTCEEIKGPQECKKAEGFGCVWDEEEEVCSESSTPKTCKEIKDKDKCKEAEKQGCLWSKDKNVCFSCEEFNKKSCEKVAELGCMWNEGEEICTETPKTCKEIEDQAKCIEAEKQGCLWSEEKNVCFTCGDLDKDRCDLAGELGCMWSEERQICFSCGDIEEKEICDKADKFGCTWDEEFNICTTKTPTGIKHCTELSTDEGACNEAKGVYGLNCKWNPELDPKNLCHPETCADISDQEECNIAEEIYKYPCGWKNNKCISK